MSSDNDTLESWKEIAAYLKRDVTTVQRWEKREGLPVHRHVHDKSGSVFALKPELDRWRRARTRAPDVVVESTPPGLRPTSTSPLARTSASTAADREPLAGIAGAPRRAFCRWGLARSS